MRCGTQRESGERNREKNLYTKESKISAGMIGSASTRSKGTSAVVYMYERERERESVRESDVGSERIHAGALGLPTVDFVSIRCTSATKPFTSASVCLKELVS